MRNAMRNKKGLSTVVTTLIILVVSVLLATVVTYYAINMTTTRVQEENLRISKSHIWANSSFSQGAFAIVNIGGRDTLLDKFQVRGQEIPWTSVWYDRQSSAPTTDLALIGNLSTSGKTNAAADLSLKSGECLVVYIDSPGSISVDDIGVTCSMTAFTASAQYKVEVNVESAS